MAAEVIAWFPTMEAFRLGQDSILSTALLLARLCFIETKTGRIGRFILGAWSLQTAARAADHGSVRRCATLAQSGTVRRYQRNSSLSAMVGWQGIFDWLSILESMDRYSWIIHPANMPNIRGLLYDWFQSGTRTVPVFIITVVISVALYAVSLYLWRGEFNVLDPVFDLKFSLAIATTILVSYHLYPHDLLPLALSLILRLARSRVVRFMGLVERVLFSFYYFSIPLSCYLIEFSVLGWGAFLILALYSILAAEIFHR